jgi:hypothetical protein
MRTSNKKAAGALLRQAAKDQIGKPGLETGCDGLRHFLTKSRGAGASA